MGHRTLCFPFNILKVNVSKLRSDLLRIFQAKMLDKPTLKMSKDSEELKTRHNGGKMMTVRHCGSQIAVSSLYH